MTAEKAAAPRMAERHSERLYDIDWIRVIGIPSVFTFHTALSLGNGSPAWGRPCS